MKGVVELEPDLERADSVDSQRVFLGALAFGWSSFGPKGSAREAEHSENCGSCSGCGKFEDPKDGVDGR